MTPADTVSALDEREAVIGELVVKLRGWPYPSTQAAADLLAGLWGELRPWLETGRQMALFEAETEDVA